MQHTPGPWKAVTYKTGYTHIVSVADDSLHIARMSTDNDGFEDAANARLIAAAPDLLAALRALLVCAEPRVSCELNDQYEYRRALLPGQIERARDAIAKAERSV